MPYSRAMSRSPSTLRTAALIAGGALSVHELRFLIAPAGAAESASAGHGYLPLAGFAVAVALAAALAHFAAAAGRAIRTGRHDPGGSGFAATWVAVTVAIVAVFLAQELVEAALTGRAAQGLSAVLGSGGWVALPLAVAVGALVAMALAGARAAVAAAARRAEPGPLPSDDSDSIAFGLHAGHPPAFAALAAHLSGRAPPLLP